MTNVHTNVVDARTRFKRGDRIRVSPEGHREGMCRRSVTAGVVVGFSRRDRWCIRVLRDGIADPETFSCSFWEHDPWAIP